MTYVQECTECVVLYGVCNVQACAKYAMCAGVGVFNGSCEQAMQKKPRGITLIVINNSLRNPNPLMINSRPNADINNSQPKPLINNNLPNHHPNPNEHGARWRPKLRHPSHLSLASQHRCPLYTPSTTKSSRCSRIPIQCPPRHCFLLLPILLLINLSVILRKL